MLASPEIVLGGPGCGKTTRLINVVEEELNAGTRPDAIAFVSFTKEAATVARDRAAVRFNLDADALPYFRTIHSLAYGALGMTRDEVMGEHDWVAFGDLVGERLTGGREMGEMMPGDADGDKMLRVIDYAATTHTALDAAWHATGEDLDWYRLKRFDAAYNYYKAAVSKLDFTDMLLAYAREGERVPVEVAVIDEAQDLTRAQWEVVTRAFTGARRVIVGGDDDQAIYGWAGADVETFLNLRGNIEVLPLSRRLPWSIWKVAQHIVRRISRRYVKPYQPADERMGEVASHYHPDDIDLHNGESWLLLARNTYFLRTLEAVARAQGVVYTRRAGSSVDAKDIVAIRTYERLRERGGTMTATEARALAKALDRPRPALKKLTQYAFNTVFGFPPNAPWHVALVGIDQERRDYYVSCLRRGERLTAPARVRIETIHGVKGAEADNVMLMTDMSARTARGYERAPDNEHRVFYVGATRARNTLHVLAPQTGTGYAF
jgi:superfamily I DNA/RNA helicase